jgi:hypothetical protein
VLGHDWTNRYPAIVNAVKRAFISLPKHRRVEGADGDKNESGGNDVFVHISAMEPARQSPVRRLRDEIAALDRELIQLRRASLPNSLASNERPRREHQLQGRLASLQRDEEALIERYENDFDIPRRPNADPLAVLGIRYGLAQAKAS